MALTALSVKLTKITGLLSLFTLAILIPPELAAMPKINIVHERNAQNFARVRITNETREELICYVAIDGHKIKFRLPPVNSSKWYKATDTRFNASHFSTWCDYIDLYPQYKKKRL